MNTINTMKTIDDTTAYVRSPEPIADGLEAELVMFSVDHGKYYHLNEVAAAIWGLLESPQTPVRIEEQLQRSFNVTPEECRAEVRRFLGVLVEKGLVLAADKV